MIVIYHQNNQVIRVLKNNITPVPYKKKETIANVMLNLAIQYPESPIFWCDEFFKENLNISDYNDYFHHHKMMLSYYPSNSNYFTDSIGYVEQSPFININKKVKYPTWQMSSVVGVISAQILSKNIIKTQANFNYFLSSLAKLAMPKGLLCYSEPKLLKGHFSKTLPQTSKYTQYKFVRQHYKLVWLFLLFFNEFIFDRKVNILPLFNALFYKRKESISLDLSSVSLGTSNIIKQNINIDVLIPTLGRKEHLYNVLKDLSQQTLLPQKVIIVEQNEDKTSVSELDYLNDTWPFVIDHTFIHQLGACNARNMALSKITGNWVFFADDDVRFEKDLLSKTFDYIHQYGVSSVTISCLQNKEIEKNKASFQWSGFGTNASIVKSKYVKKCSFKPEHEFGYGEDTDYGMQLKNLGCDTIYLPFIKMLHLKAPIGGFRSEFTPLWSKEEIQPKPSPTVLAYHLKHHTKQQLLGYKVLLFIKFYKSQHIKNIFSYISLMNKKWEKSVYWATKMMSNEA